jgi:putative transcriptional regulator
MRLAFILAIWLPMVALADDVQKADAPPSESSKPHSASLAPAFLVASSGLLDPNFRKTVILLLAHDEEGAVGLILTHPSHVLGAEVGRKLHVDVTGKAATTAVLEGGPVDPDRGFLVHAREDLADDHSIAPGLYVDAPERILAAVLKEGETQARLVVGYSGWGPGQLEGEVARGDWSVAPVDAHAVFEVAPLALWDTLKRGANSNPPRARRKDEPPRRTEGQGSVH